jgi:hypothetical protein
MGANRINIPEMNRTYIWTQHALLCYPLLSETFLFEGKHVS